MKRLLKISLSVLLLALAFAVTQIPEDSVNADTASVSTDADFQMNGTTLMKYTGTAKTVSVPASVESIGEEAFANHSEIEVLQFKGNQVTDISYRAFAGCSGIKVISLPDSVQELGSGVFSDCTSLKKIEFGANLHKLGINPFSNCSSLETIVISKDNTAFVVDDSCLYNKEKSKLLLMLPMRNKDKYSMPSTVTDIAEYAFWNCESLQKVSLSGNLKAIPAYSFANCKSLTDIVIPYSVNEIGLKAFSHCVNLETADIPASVSFIHETSFDGCNKLVISADTGTTAYLFYQTFKEKNQAEYEDTWDYLIPDTEEKEGEEDDSSNDNSKDNEHVLASTHVVGNRAVLFIDNSAQSVFGSMTMPDTVSGDSFTSLENQSLMKGTDIPKYTVAFDTIISDLAYYKAMNMNDYEFPNGITEIGEFSFSRSNIKHAKIPSGVTTIGYGAFYHCDYLREVTIPSSVVYIAPEAFSKSMWLENWLNGTGKEEYLVVGNGILLAYRGNGGNISIPDTVKRIGSQAFANNNTILSVNIPDSVIEIGEDAFRDCKNLETVTGGKNVRIIRDRAFSGCVLSSAHVGIHVEHMGLASFDFKTTNVGESSKVVVFDSEDNLPKPSYELTAERLSNDYARDYLLGDTLFAIVDKRIKIEDLDGTVLDPSGNGFKGIIAYISSRDKGLVTCLATTFTENELAQVYIPDFISIDGKTYQVIGKENVTVFGEQKLDTEGNILVQNSSNTIKNVHDVSMEGNTGSFSLRIEDSEDAYEMMSQAYEEIYRESLPKDTVCVQMTLIDRKTSVPITKTGKQMVKITMDLPDLISNGSIRVLTTDRNGQLENVAYTRNEDEITFSVNHFSPFAFINVNSEVTSVYAEGTVRDDGTVVTSLGKLDDSPDTSDMIHPKWILATGLLCMSFAVLIIKKKQKESPGI